MPAAMNPSAADAERYASRHDATDGRNGAFSTMYSTRTLVWGTSLLAFKYLLVLPGLEPVLLSEEFLDEAGVYVGYLRP